MKDSKVKSKRWKKFIVKYIRANRNIHLRRIDMRNTAFVICVSDSPRMSVVNSIDFLTRRVTRHWRSHLSKKRKSLAIYRAAGDTATRGLAIPFLPRRELIFRGDDPSTAVGGRSIGRSGARAPLMASIFPIALFIARILSRSRFHYVGNFRLNKISSKSRILFLPGGIEKIECEKHF